MIQPGTERKNLHKLKMISSLQYILQVTIVDDNCSCVCIFNECSQTNSCHSLQLHLHPPANQQLLPVAVCHNNIICTQRSNLLYASVVTHQDLWFVSSYVAGLTLIGQCCAVVHTWSMISGPLRPRHSTCAVNQRTSERPRRSTQLPCVWSD